MPLVPQNKSQKVSSLFQVFKYLVRQARAFVIEKGKKRKKEKKRQSGHEQKYIGTEMSCFK